MHFEKRKGSAWPCLLLAGQATALLVLGLGLGTTAVRAERPRIYALTGGTVVVSPGRTLEGATVILRDGLIEAVGVGLSVPADAQEIDATGRFIYPGLIDAHSELGIRSEGRASGTTGGRGGAPAERSTPAGAIHPLSEMRAEYRALDHLAPFEGDAKSAMERIRGLGFAAVLSTPSDGILRGTSTAILLLADRSVAEIVLRDGVAQHAAFDRAGFGAGYPTSLMGSVAAIRQAFLDAKRFAEWSDAYAKDPAGMPRPPYHATFDALRPLFGGGQALFVVTENTDDTLLADRVAREFDIPLVVSTSGAEWELADTVASTGRTLIVSVAFPDKPKVGDDDEALAVSTRDLRRWVGAAAGPLRLHEAGVPFALTLNGLDNSGDFGKNVREMIEAGLPEEVALAALTTVPAELLGLTRVLGTLEAGKLANVVVTDGPLFGEETKVREVFVDGIRHEIKVKEKPTGDPNAIVDPRGDWSVTFEFGPQGQARTWTIAGDKDAYTGTAETRGGTVEFEEVKLAGNVLTVRFPSQGQRGSFEVTVVIEGDTFEGSAEMGSRSITVKGSRTSGPGGGGR